MSNSQICSSIKIKKEGKCERQRSIVKIWEECYLKVTTSGIMVYDSEGSSLLYSHSFSDIISIEKTSLSIYRQFTILIKLRNKSMLRFSFSCKSEVDDWYTIISDTQISFLNKYTNEKRLGNARIKRSDSSSENEEISENLDAELCIILRRLSICNTQDELKTILFEIQRFQNEKPIEIVALQKPFVQQSFNDIKESRSFLLNDKIQHSMDYLLDNFDCFTEDGDDKEEEKDFEARTVNIMNVVQFGEAIGRGKYGIVRKGIYLDTNEVVAVKIIQKNEQQPRDIECIKRECKIMYSLRRHPNVISLKDFCQDNEFFYIIEEIAEGGELFDAIVQRKSYCEREAQQVVRTLLYTLKYCHNLNIVHRDLKPENILLKKPNDYEYIKITDFGFATYAESDYDLRTICGTPGYSAPEIIRGESYGPPVDMWSLGVITYILLCGYPPFPQSNDISALRMIVSANFEFHEREWAGISEEAKDFIRALLVADPQRRATASMAMQLPWMKFESQRTMHLNEAVQELEKLNAHMKKHQQESVHTITENLPQVKPPEDQTPLFYCTLTNCGVVDSPSLARRNISMIPAQNKIPVQRVIYTTEGVWVLLKDYSNRNWVLVEKHGYDPMCIPMKTHVYVSRSPRGTAMHNIRDSPSMKGQVVGRIPSGVLFVGIDEISNEEGIWVRLHRQTLHTYDLPTNNSCYLCALMYPSSQFVDRL